MNTPKEALRIFESGAGVGYLNQDYYDIPISEKYIAEFKEVMNNTFKEQTNDKGLIELIFNRLFLTAISGT